MVTIITKDVDDECISIRNLFQILKDKRGSIDYQKIAQQLRNCEHKLYAVWHHYKSIEKHIHEKIQNFQKEYIPPTGADVETLDYNLIYGTEAFLFQVVSNLDLITQLLGRFIPELKSFRTRKGRPYRLLPLPWPAAKYDAEGERLPATYANFLIINGAVLVPLYNDPNDRKALAVIQAAFPDRKVLGIDSSVLIRQHGSLHCVTMQIPEGVLR